MRRLAIILLPAFLIPLSIEADTQPITHEGVVGYFLPREDMEEVIVIMDERDRLEQTVKELEATNVAQRNNIVALEVSVEYEAGRALRWLRASCILGGVAVAELVLLGVVLWTLWPS